MWAEIFTTAITQLGSDVQTVCLGGLFSLEQLEAESEVKSFPTLDVLRYFIKDKAKKRTLLLENNSEKNEEIVEIETLIQAALLAVNRIFDKSENKSKSLYDLSYIELDNFVFRGTHLDQINLKSAQLNKLIFRNGKLYGSNLMGANLEYADLTSTDIRSANLSLCRLYKAKLNNSFLRNVDLTSADMSYSDLSAACFQGSDLSNANFSHSILTGADLRGAKGLTSSQLEKAEDLASAFLPKYLFL